MRISRSARSPGREKVTHLPRAECAQVPNSVMSIERARLSALGCPRDALLRILTGTREGTVPHRDKPA
eukprot:2525853-Prymnesium_polylepis.1